MTNETVSLINSIIEIAKDYEGVEFNNRHVKKWLNQFPLEQHELILKELNSVLSNSYLTREGVIGFFNNIIISDKIFPDSIENYCFINPQEQGGSQEDLLEILNEVVQEKYGISLEECGQSNVTSYIYIDDAIYSGNRVIRDIQKWAEEIDDVNAVERIDIIVVALHNRNLNYVRNNIQQALPNTKVTIWRALEFSDNLRESSNRFESFWPSEELDYNELTNEYIESVIATRTEAQNNRIPILRSTGKPRNENYFTNLSNRKHVEKIFFEKGVEIVSYAANPNPNMRPMGYDNSRTLGFGSYLVTYRNIANNCPVVLWWGNPNALSGINNWYPLFPRTTN